jgi:hypothetical protein
MKRIAMYMKLQQCPICLQGEILPVAVIPLAHRRAWICEECEAFWDSAASVGAASVYMTYPEYMERHGVEGVWSNLLVLSVGDNSEDSTGHEKTA